MKTMTVIKVSAAGKPSQIVAVKVLNLEEGKELEAYYKEIKCSLIDHVVIDCERGIDMLVDDEGALGDKPLNKVASCLAERSIYGDVLLVSFRDNEMRDAEGKPVFDGDWHSLDREQAKEICQLVTMAFMAILASNLMKGA